MTLQELIAQHGYGLRVKLPGELAHPFTVVETRFGLYYFVQYDDGRTGYLDKRRCEGDYEIWNGAACTEGARMACIQPVVGSTPIGSTEREQEQCGQDSNGLQVSPGVPAGTLWLNFFRQLFGFLDV